MNLTTLQNKRDPLSESTPRSLYEYLGPTIKKDYALQVWGILTADGVGNANETFEACKCVLRFLPYETLVVKTTLPLVEILETRDVFF